MAFDGGVLLLDHTGTIIAADRYPLNVLGQDWSDRAYVRQMLDVPGLVFSNITPDGPEGAESIVVAMPVYRPVDKDGKIESQNGTNWGDATST